MTATPTPTATSGETRMLAALARRHADATPVWFMRQAGRCLADYRALRERYDILTLAKTPELCAQVTLMPIEAFGVDAAVMFADIMLPPIGMGVGVAFTVATWLTLLALKELTKAGRITIVATHGMQREWAGAFGDLGTLIPFVVAYIALGNIDPVGIFLSFGLALCITGAYYRTPFPVQPMKAIGAAATTQAGITAGTIYGAGLITGLIWLVLGITGATRKVANLVQRPVALGIIDARLAEAGFSARLAVTRLARLAGLVLGLAVLLTFGLMQTPAYAQEERQERETKKTPTMSEAVYKKLLEAQELIEAKSYDEGLVILREMESNGDRMSSYERAQVFNFMAYTYFTLERYQDALRYYEKVIAEPENTEGLLLNTLYTVAQLYFVIEDYQKAVDTINKWFEASPTPSLNAYMLLGQGYYQLEKYKEALVPLVDAHEMVTSRGEKPKEILLLLMQNIHLQLDNYPKMIDVLRELVVLYPKAEHWRSLSAAYSELEQYDKQMAILEMLYEDGQLQNGRNQMNLANLYLMHEAPYKAAKLIDKGLKEGLIEPEVRNLQLLAQSWQQSQEMEESIDPLIKAAAKAEDGNIHIRLAQSYISLDMYEEAAEAVRAGLRKGKIDRPDQAYLMLGMAEFEQQKFEAAKQAFANASGDERSKKAAEDWIKYVESEMNRKQQLELSLQRRRS